MPHQQVNRTETLQGFRDYLFRIQRSGLTGSAWHSDFDAWLRKLEAEVSVGSLRPEAIRAVWQEAAAEALTTNTCQGYVCSKPRGYNGDFEIMERIYSGWRSPDPILAMWDDYFHVQTAPQAVQNRKRYFVKWLNEWEARSNGSGLRVLNIGSGPARDVFEYLVLPGFPGSILLAGNEVSVPRASQTLAGVSFARLTAGRRELGLAARRPARSTSAA